MIVKRIALRPAAKQDVADIAAYYQREAGDALAVRWTQAIESALEHVAAHPAAGSSRYMGQIGSTQLRFWRVRGFPYLVFYVEAAQEVDVWHILHAERDIPHWLLSED